MPDQHDICERAGPSASARYYVRGCPIVDGVHDAPLRPIAEKRGVTVGMAMTEKQGGSDVRANTTRAIALGKGGPGAEYRSSATNGFAPRP